MTWNKYFHENPQQNGIRDVEFAKNAFVDFIVVGRPIYKSDNPASVVEKILEKL